MFARSLRLPMRGFCHHQLHIRRLTPHVRALCIVAMQRSPLLAPPPALSSLRRRERVALFLDFDGTLVDLAPTPDSIEVPAELGAMLERLSKALEGRLAIVSGRSTADLKSYLGELDVARAGSHGAECILSDGTALSTNPPKPPRALRDKLMQLSDQIPALEVEEKSFGFGLHYRAQPDLEDQIIAYGVEFAQSYGLKAKRGKFVFELTTASSDKGDAVGRFLATDVFAGAFPIFVGDDLTDEDGFRASKASGGFGIAVGEREPAGASYHLATTQAVLEWLQE